MIFVCVCLVYILKEPSLKQVFIKITKMGKRKAFIDSDSSDNSDTDLDKVSGSSNNLKKFVCIFRE